MRENIKKGMKVGDRTTARPNSEQRKKIDKKNARRGVIMKKRKRGGMSRVDLQK